MYLVFKKYTMFLFSIIMSIFLLTGCTSLNNNKCNNTEMVDFLGNKVNVPKNAQRILAPYLEDYLLSLDVKPSGQWSVGNGNVQDYLQPMLSDTPKISYNLPIESVIENKPDLLLVSSSALVSGNKYNEYSNVAPTYVVKNGSNISWEEQFRDIAKVVNREDKAEKVIKEYNENIEKTKKTLFSGNNPKSAAALWIINNQFYIMNKNIGSGKLIYNDLGFLSTKIIDDLSNECTNEWVQLPLEKLSQLDTEDIFLVNSETNSPILNELVWKNLKAVKNDRVYKYEQNTSWLYKGPIAFKQTIDLIKDKYKK